MSSEASDVDGVPEHERVYVLEWGNWGPPHGGTYHQYADCWALTRSDSDREVTHLPWPQAELEADDEWDVCGHCQRVDTDAEPTDDVEEAGRDHENVADLQEAYHTTDSIAAAARQFPDASYQVVRHRLIDAGIHEPGAHEVGGADGGAAGEGDDGADAGADGGAAGEGDDGTDHRPVTVTEHVWQDPPDENPVSVPDWLDERSFYRALDMGDDVDEVCEILGWDDRDRVAALARAADAGLGGG